MTENTVNVDIYKVVYGNLVVMRVDSPATAKQLRAIVNSPALRAYYSADNSIVTKDNINEHLCGGGGGGTAASVSYDNTESALEADNVQTAIDEVAGRGGQAPLVIEYTLDGESEMRFDYLLDGVTEMKSAMDSGRDVMFIMTFNVDDLGLSIPVEYKLAAIMDITAMGQRIIEAHFGAVSSGSILEELMEDASSGLAMLAMVADDPESGEAITMTQMAFEKPGSSGGGSASETEYDPPSGHSEYGYDVQSALNRVIANLGSKVTTITSSSTDDQTPSAKAVYNLFGNRVTKISSYSTDDQTPSAKAVYDFINRVTTITSSSTDKETPSAKAVYNLVGNRVTTITSSSTDNETPSAKATYNLFDAIKSAKVTTVTSSSTDDQYPSARAVYNLFGTRVTNITSSSTDNETPSARATYNLFDAINSAKVTTITSSSTDNEYPSAKAVYNLLGTIESALEEI